VEEIAPLIELTISEHSWSYLSAPAQIAKTAVEMATEISKLTATERV
jgi:hypothetical protein